jgi:3-keto-disaccharide hydrolase
MRAIPLVAFVLGAVGVIAAAAPRQFAVENGTGLEFVHVVPQTVTYQGKKALRLVETPGAANGTAVALLSGVDFSDGTIDVDTAGKPAAGSDVGARGFVGLAFRSTAHGGAFDCIYIRPTNGRADDQLRRNHATQYTSEPDFPWQKLRTEAPGVYESYVDLESGAWTHLKIEVSGVKARLFVNGASQAALIVNDLKRGATRGQVGLWIGAGTEAYFRNLQLTTN